MNGNFKPPPIFVISLPRSVERREAISARLKNLGLHSTFFDAIDGADFYTDARYFNAEKCKAHEKRIMNAGEVGCALSHIGVYKKIEEQKLPFALVLEDDALISGDLPRVLRELEPHIKPNDFITIEHCDIYCRFKQQTLFAEYRLVKPLLSNTDLWDNRADILLRARRRKKSRASTFPFSFPRIVGAYTKTE